MKQKEQFKYLQKLFKQQFMKTNYFLVALLFLISCNNGIEEINELPNPKSSLVELQYKTGSGNSSNEVTNLLGYGYDATGFCDTTSARAKILDLTDSNGDIYMGNPNSTSPLLISGNNYASFSEKVNNVNITNYAPIALNSHLKSLVKIAFNSDSINPNDALAYFSYTCVYSHYRLFVISDRIKTTESFNHDVSSLTTKELISKYGTHVLTNIYLGSKVEVLYRCDGGSAESAQQASYRRINQFFGATAGIIIYDPSVKYNAKNEQLIYNTIGSKLKICGLINATDYNPDNIHKNIYAALGDNIDIQFMQIGEDGLLPLYEVINDSTKKREIKEYIEKYISEN